MRCSPSCTSGAHKQRTFLAQTHHKQWPGCAHQLHTEKHTQTRRSHKHRPLSVQTQTHIHTHTVEAASTLSGYTRICSFPRGKPAYLTASSEPTKWRHLVALPSQHKQLMQANDTRLEKIREWNNEEKNTNTHTCTATGARFRDTHTHYTRAPPCTFFSSRGAFFFFLFRFSYAARASVAVFFAMVQPATPRFGWCLAVCLRCRWLTAATRQ